MYPKRPPLPKPPPYGINSSSEPKPESDEINSPSHYTQGPIEVIEIIEGFENNLPNFGLPSHLANVIKYILRAGQKAESPALKDLLKAQYYLNRYIKLMQIAEESQKPEDTALPDMVNTFKPHPRLVGADSGLNIRSMRAELKTNNELMVGGCFPDPMDTKYRNWAIGDYIQPKENKKKEKEGV